MNIHAMRRVLAQDIEEQETRTLEARALTLRLDKEREPGKGWADVRDALRAYHVEMRRLESLQTLFYDVKSLPDS